MDGMHMRTAPILDHPPMAGMPAPRNFYSTLLGCAVFIDDH
jgi:hypothetical protein